MNCQCLDIGTRRIYTCVDNETQIDSMRQNCVCVCWSNEWHQILYSAIHRILQISIENAGIVHSHWHTYVLREMLNGENGHECDNRMVMPLFVKRKIVSIIKGVYVLSNLY